MVRVTNCPHGQQPSFCETCTRLVCATAPEGLVQRALHGESSLLLQWLEAKLEFGDPADLVRLSAGWDANGSPVEPA
jgi:hypothetical protein